MELSIGFTKFTFSLKSHTLTNIKNKLEIGRYAEGKESYWMKVHPDMDLTIQEWEEKRLGKLFLNCINITHTNDINLKEACSKFPFLLKNATSKS